MSNENKSIHEFDLKLICEYFSLLERQGPGSPEVTIKALSFIDNLTNESHIADIGCGTGGQTMVLAQNAPGQITGIDLFPTFIDLFNLNAGKLNLQDRIKGVVGSMDKLPFQNEEYDLIWSEGAIYNIGFEKGLKEWRKFLKKGGYIAVATFILPEDCWTEHFYAPQITAQEEFLKKHAGNKTAEEFIANQRFETQYYYKYKEYYGYVFYIGRKI
jgi:ubiquinone/menaquinone biosynthesis C-methylase UbiE